MIESRQRQSVFVGARRYRGNRIRAANGYSASSCRTVRSARQYTRIIEEGFCTECCICRIDIRLERNPTIRRAAKINRITRITVRDINVRIRETDGQRTAFS